jgi:hypothetical protein
MKLDLGSGWKQDPGWVTVDCRGTPDILCDLETTALLKKLTRINMPTFDGYLWQDGITDVVTGGGVLFEGMPNFQPIEHIRASHVLEHIRNLCQLMDMCWEILQEGGTFEIIVPHKDSPTAWQDPTHVRFFVPETFYYFTDHKHLKYVEHYWKMIEKPSNLDAYNNPAEPGAPWCNIRVVLGKESA